MEASGAVLRAHPNGLFSIISTDVAVLGLAGFVAQGRFSLLSTRLTTSIFSCENIAQTTAQIEHLRLKLSTSLRLSRSFVAAHGRLPKDRRTQ